MFRLDESFVAKYAHKKPPFGFGALGWFTYVRTYSRVKDDGTNEKWWETVRRVVEGTYRMQEKHISQHGLGWDPVKAQESAQEMYDRIWSLKFTPPGRGLWAMGSELTESRGVFAALNNCAFVSTENISTEGGKPFEFLMDMSMLGVGVGFDVRGANTTAVYRPGNGSSFYDPTYVVPDTREGWVISTRMLIDSYMKPGRGITEFDYSLIRPAGTPIKGFGGVAAGPDPLKILHNRIMKVLDRRIGNPISATDIVDIMNMIGACVIAGNVRRTAEIVFGPDTDEYLDLKNYDVNPQREDWGWTSNNSIFAQVGQNYFHAADRTAKNGEPGYAWLANMQNYSRMNNGPDFKDHRVRGGNPCLEQSLEPYELCCLVETYPENHDNLQDYQRTLKFAYLYAKTVTLGATHWPETNRVMLRNRRIGTSMTGISQFITSRGLSTLREWAESGYDTIQYYDEVYSDWLAVPRSIKTTSIKPSGTVSLLAGATPGLHYPESRYYIRRVRVGEGSPLLTLLREANYHVEPSVNDPRTMVVSFPIGLGDDIRTIDDVSMWEQLSLAAFMQRHWADNQVSATITFKPHEADQIPHALDYFQYQLKGVSFLPKLEVGGAYAQMPYEQISAEQYHTMTENLFPVDFDMIVDGFEKAPERGCDGEACELSGF
jgi:ribonucleoside-triphosphate reductase